MKRTIIYYKPWLKKLARELRKHMTFSEVLLWNELKQKKIMGYDFDRQRPIDNYIVDFYCKELKLAIEADGERHQDEKVIANDLIRQRRLESLGVIFLRIENEDVLENIEGVVERIKEFIREMGGPTAGHSGEGKEPTPDPSEEGNGPTPSPSEKEKPSPSPSEEGKRGDE